MTAQPFTADEISLMKAVTAGNTGDVKTLLESCPALSAQYALVQATKNNDLGMLHFLVGLGAKPDEADGEGYTPLMRAAWQGKADMLQTFLDYGANIDAQDSAGYTPLMRVAENGSEDGKHPRYVAALNLLVERGANLALKNKQGKTAEDLARAKEENGALAAMLAVAQEQRSRRESKSGLSAAANAALQKPLAPDALWHAVLRGEAENITRLIRAGADPNEKRGFETTMGNAVRVWSLDAVRALAEGGADIELCDGSGNTALISAAMHERGRDIFDYLLSRGARPDAKNNLSQTPLIAAAATGDTGMIGALLEKGVDINAQDHLGVSPLMMAALHGRTEAALFLLERGADATLIAEGGYNAAGAAESKGFYDLAEAIPARAAALRRAAEEAAEAARNGVLHDTAAARQQALRRNAPRLKPGGMS